MVKDSSMTFPLTVTAFVSHLPVCPCSRTRLLFCGFKIGQQVKFALRLTFSSTGLPESRLQKYRSK